MSSTDPPRRRSSRGSSRGPTNPTSRHPSSTPVDASNIPIQRLIELTRDGRARHEITQHLDFVNCSNDRIRRIFYKDSYDARSRDDEGNIKYPIQAIRRTANEIRNFYKAGPNQKDEMNKLHKNDVIDTTNLITYSEYEALMATAATAEEQEEASTEVAEEAAEPRSEIEEDDEENAVVGHCPGFTMNHIYDMKHNAEVRMNRLIGFKHTIREGWTTRQRLEHPDSSETWTYKLPVVSVLTCGNDVDKHVWVIEQNDTISSQSDDDYDNFNKFNIRHVNCERSNILKPLQQGLCTTCLEKKKQLINRIDGNYNIRNEDWNPKNRNSIGMRTYSLQQNQTQYYATKAKNLSQKLSYRDRAIEKLTSDTGVDVQVNASSDEILSTTVADNVSRFLNSDPNDRTNAIADYVFREAVTKYQQAKAHGRKSVRHSPLVIRLGALIKQKMTGRGIDLYNLVAKSMGLPDARSIQRYTAQSNDEPDGILLSNIDAARQKFDIQFPNCAPDDNKRFVRLAHDEMKIKGRFGVNHNTNTLIAIANDAFEQSVIEREFSALASNDGDNEAEVIVPEATKYFLAFIATTINNGTKQHIFVARYGVKKTHHDFLARRLKEIPAVLYNYGFIVTHLGHDGASENRAVCKLLGHITAEDILRDKFSTHELRDLNLNFPVAYKHPSPGCENIYILFGSDMPHLVKKIRNAFDNKSRSLTFRERVMNLAMIEKIWLAYETKGSLPRRTYLTVDHFELDSNKKMRVFLAMQILSQSTIDMITNHCNNKENDSNIDDYQGMIELFDNVNRLVDICNARDPKDITKSKRDRGIEKINHPKHKHVLELLDILRVFESWKSECGGKFNNKFITKQTYEDLLWVVYGIVGFAALYLKDDNSWTIDQGVFGSDCCEHFFAATRQYDQNPDLTGAIRAAGKQSSLNAVLTGHMFKSKRKRGTNTSGVDDDDAARYVAPLPKKKKESKFM